MSKKMPTKENLIESFIWLINSYFDMDVVAEEDNFPYIQSAQIKAGNSLEEFINELLKVIDVSDTTGKLMYYFDNELDFDTPEEYHRH